MPSFELNSPDGKVFEVDAPNAAAAVAAFQKMSAPAQPAKTESVPQTDAMGNFTGMTEAPAGGGMGYGQQMRNVGDFLDKGARMIANGATFGLADKLAGGADYLTGAAPSYDAGVRGQRAQTEAIREAHPVAAALSEAGGGLASGAGLVRGGVTLAGRVGTGLLPRVLGYGAEGAAYGAAHGAGNTYSDELSDYLKNAGKSATVGAMVGSGLPIIGSAARALYRTGAAFLGPRVEGAGRGASALLRGAAQADEQGLRNLSQLGPEAMLPDAGPAMLGLAQGAGTGTGAGRSELINVLRDRDVGTAQRLARSLDQHLGPAPVPSQVEAGLRADRSALGPAYEDALNQARAVDTQSIVNQIEGMIPNVRGDARAALQRVRNDLFITDARGNTGVPDPHPRALLETRKAIDGITGATQDRNVQRVLGDVRKMVDDELTAKVPGIKTADSNFAESMRQSEALERGQNILDSGKSAVRPQELAAELVKGANSQGVTAGPSAVPVRIRQGARADIDRRVGTNINDLTQLERTFGTPQDWNHQKLGMVFGEGPRDRVAADIAANRQFRDTYQKIVQNSQTAQRMEAADALKGAQGGNIPTDLTATSLSLKAINGIAKLLSGQSNMNTRDEVGRLLARQGPDARRLAMELLNSAQVTGANARSVAGLLSAPQWIGATSPAYGRR